MPKILTIGQIMAKKYTLLDKLPPRLIHSVGILSSPFSGIIWGPSGNGKTNFLIQLIEGLAACGNVLYVSLEEGHERTMQNTVGRHLAGNPALAAKVRFADHDMNYVALQEKLRKRKSPQFIIIDSLQYLNINYDQWKTLKEEFRNKSFLFISHAVGKNPDGRAAGQIRYDVGLKIRVEGFVAHVTSRYGGNNPYIIWEEGAKRHYGTKYRTIARNAYKEPKPAAAPAL